MVESLLAKEVVIYPNGGKSYFYVMDRTVVIDVVDEYGAMARPCSMHSIFQNAMYVPFGNIACRTYAVGDVIEIQYGNKTTKFVVNAVKDHVTKDEAAELYTVIE